MMRHNPLYYENIKYAKTNDNDDDDDDFTQTLLIQFNGRHL